MNLSQLPQQWLVNQESLDSLLAHIAAGAPAQEKPKPVYSRIAHVSGGAVSAYDSLSTAPAGSIGIIKIEGVLAQYSDPWFGLIGYSTISSLLDQFAAAPNIASIILDINSPGGAAIGVEAVADQILATNKPIVAYVSGICCSAAYWIASAADKIILSGNTSMVGSIGTMTTAIDFTGLYEKFGLKVHTINSTHSPDKNKSYELAKQGDYSLIRSETLDPLAVSFLDFVKSQRDIKPEALTGSVYFGQKAISLGLADSIGDFAFAADQLQANHQSSNMKLKFSAIAAMWAAIGFAKPENAEAEVEVSAEDLGKANTSIEGLNSQVATLTQQLADANQKAETAENALATANTSVAKLQGTINALVTATGKPEAELEAHVKAAHQAWQKSGPPITGSSAVGTEIHGNSGDPTPKPDYVIEAEKALETF